MLLRTLAGLIRPTEGRVLVDGKTLGEDLSFPENMGILIEKPNFLGYLNGFDNLKILSEIRGILSDADIRRYMQQFSLDPNSRQIVKKYSLGMKQKLGIIQAIMESPELLILDEPFNALDEESVNLVRTLLLQYREKGTLILLTSHHKEDITAVCDETMLLQEGRQVTRSESSHK